MAAGFAARTTDPFANYSLVTPDFFPDNPCASDSAAQITPRDNRDAPPVAVINEAMARRLSPGEDPIGQRVTVTIVPGEQPRGIVGIVGDLAKTATRSFCGAEPVCAAHAGVAALARPVQNSRVGIAYMLRINQPLSSIVPQVRRAVAEVDNSLPVTQVEMMDEFLARQVDAPGNSMAYGRNLRRGGAAAGDLRHLRRRGVWSGAADAGDWDPHGARRATRIIIGLVMRQSAILTGVGLVLGVGVASMTTKYLNSLLFELTPLETQATLIAMPALFAVVAAVASDLPARRATRLDPQTVLRCD